MEGRRLYAPDVVENIETEHGSPSQIEHDIHGLVLKANIRFGIGIGNLRLLHIDPQYIVLLISAPLL